MKKNIYFEPPSRLQLLDKLKHFVRFSDFLLLVSGDRGAGKSTLLSQLQPDDSDNTLNFCLISPESELSEEQLLELLIGQFPSHEQGGAGFADQLKVFHLQLKAMQASGVKCLIAVDDAELLSPSALNLLLNIHAADAQVLLVSENKYAESLLEYDSVKHMEGRVHHLIIEGMTGAEAAEYLEICHPAVSSLPEKKKSELIRLSEGMPGRVETLLAGGKVAIAPSSRKVSAFPLPMVHMLGIAALLVAIVAASLWKFMPEEAVSQELIAEGRVSKPLDVEIKPSIDSEEKTVAVIDVNREVAVEEVERSVETDPGTVSEEAVSPEVDRVKLDLAARLKEQEALLRKKAPPVEPALKSKPKSANEAVVASSLENELRAVVNERRPSGIAAERPPSVEPESVPESKPQGKKARVSGSSEYEKELLGWPSKGYTLQMLGARSKASALDFIASQADASKFYHFETVYKGLPWHVVVYGQYVNRDIANASIRKLPKALQKVKPWARSVQGVQIDIRKK